MHEFTKALALSTMGLFLGGVAYAAAEKPTPITSLKCTGHDGSSLNDAVYAYNFSSTTSPVALFFTVYLDGTKYKPLALEQFHGSGYSDCTLLDLDITEATITQVSTVGVGIDVDAGQLSEDSIKQSFTEVDFSAKSVNLAPDVTMKATPATPEEQAKAFQSYKARAFSLPKR